MGKKNKESKKTDFGYYEKRLCLLILLSTVTNTFSALQVVITQYTPPFHCDIESIYNKSGDDLNMTRNELLNRTIPYLKNDENDLVRSSCTYYNISSSDLLSSKHASNTSVTCSKYTFYGPTKSATMKLKMVCDRAYIGPIMTSLFMAGKLVGGMIGGVLSDRFGRRPCFLIFTFYQHALIILQSFTSEPISYGILMFLSGFGDLVNYMAIAVIGTEMIPPRFRHAVLFLNSAGFGIGYMLTPLLGYYFVDWRWYLRVSGFAGVIYIPYYWLIDETPYWLLSRGRKGDAIKVLEKIAKLNGTEMEDYDKISHTLLSKNSESSISIKKSWIALFKCWKLLYRLVIVSYSWFLASILYYTIALGTNHLNGDRFMNLFYAAVMEVSSAFVYLFFTSYCEQRNTLIAFMTLTGLCVTFSPLIRSWNVVASIIIFMLGKLSSAVVFAIVYAYTGEIFPTAIRHSAIATASMCSRIGGIVAPYLVFIGQNGQEATSTLSVGVMAFISAVLYLKLPNTKNLPLPKTIQEAKQMNKGVLLQLDVCKKGNNENMEVIYEAERECDPPPFFGKGGVQ